MSYVLCLKNEPEEVRSQSQRFYGTQTSFADLDCGLATQPSDPYCARASFSGFSNWASHDSGFVGPSSAAAYGNLSNWSNSGYQNVGPSSAAAYGNPSNWSNLGYQNVGPSSAAAYGNPSNWSTMGSYTAEQSSAATQHSQDWTDSFFDLNATPFQTYTQVWIFHFNFELMYGYIYLFTAYVVIVLFVFLDTVKCCATTL